MFKYIIWHDGGWLRDSSDLGCLYETEEEAREESELATCKRKIYERLGY